MPIFMILALVALCTGCLLMIIDVWRNKVDKLTMTGWLLLALAAPLMVLGFSAKNNENSKDLVNLSARTAMLQSERWNENSTYLDSQVSLEEKDSSFNDWFTGKKLSKIFIESRNNSLVFEYGIKNKYIRVTMTNGRVVNVNCSKMRSFCPSIDELNSTAKPEQTGNS